MRLLFIELSDFADYLLVFYYSQPGHIIQGGESALYLNNIGNYKRRFEAEEDGRKMSLGAVVIMAHR